MMTSGKSVKEISIKSPRMVIIVSFYQPMLKSSVIVSFVSRSDSVFLQRRATECQCVSGLRQPPVLSPYVSVWTPPFRGPLYHRPPNYPLV